MEKKIWIIIGSLAALLVVWYILGNNNSQEQIAWETTTIEKRNIMNWPITIAPFSIILAFGFSTVIGVFFGWYPARKAANMIPISALRYE